jgi:CO/xanthine dehydrogenase FAD-binding subunit
MKSAPFDYFAPTSVDEVRGLLNQYGDDAKILAGGQSLVPVMALRLSQPSVVIDVNRLRELDYIRDDAHGLAIGAITRHRTVERSPQVREKAPLLSAAIEWIGHPQIRNRGTIGGSLAHADPAAELPALAVALDATFTVTNASGAKRTLKASDFFVSYLTTALAADDLLSDIYFPSLPAGMGWSFKEIARRHGDFALVGVAATVGLDGAGACSDVRVALFGVAPTPVRAPGAEQALLGQQPGEQAIAAAAAAISSDIDPPADVHASAAYRVYVATNLVRQALTEAVQRAQ